MRGVDDGRGGRTLLARVPGAAAAIGLGVTDGVEAADDARTGRKSGSGALKKSPCGETLREDVRTPAADSRKRARRDSIGPRLGVLTADGGALIFNGATAGLQLNGM